MAQVSYGTITITDTNDVESIVVEYNRNQSTTTPPAQTDSGWSTTRPAWAQGYYIWQRTRTHKSGTQASEDTLGNAVCITGSTGQTGTSITISSIKYAISDEDVAIDKQPYHFRKTAVDLAGRLDETIVGGSLGWNQLVQNGNFADSTGWSKGGGVTSFSVANNTATLNIASGVTYNKYLSRSNMPIISEHKYLVSAVMASPVITQAFIKRSSDGTINASGTKTISSADTFVAGVYAETKTGTANFYFRFSDTATSADTTATVKKAQIIDLTQLFGTTIADYIYSLEQSSAGAGVAWVKRYIDLDTYHEYDAGSIKSVEGLESHDTVGFNQWDEEWESGTISTSGVKMNDSNYIRSKNYIPVLPNTHYYFNSNNNSFRVFYYDANKSFIRFGGSTANTIFTTPNNCYYILFRPESTYGTTYNHDICINISDPSKNGTYEPYEKHSYPLDSTLTLRGVPKLVTDHIEFDGDKYRSDGQVERRYGIVDLGTLNISKNASYSGLFNASVPNRKIGSNVLFVCDKYLRTDSTTVISLDKSIGFSTNSVIAYIHDDAYSDAESFKAAVSGVYLVYELATPTTETAQPYQSPMIVGATEEYVSESVVPVGHESRYMLGTTTQPADSEFTYDDPPNIQDGKWLWVRTTYSDNSKTYLKTRQGYSGESGRSLSDTITQYTTATNAAIITESNMNEYTWNDNVPIYSSSKPTYWVRVTNRYSNPVSVEYVIYKDNGITDAMSTAAAANTTANTANQTANEAKEIAQQTSTDVTNLQTRTKYFWTNLIAHTKGSGGWTKPDYPVGTFAASGISGTTFDYENSSTYGYNTLYSNGIKLRYNAINLGELTGSSLTFYRPSTTSQGSKGMELTSSTLKFFDATGTVAQATFGGTQATISGTINVYDGKIGNNSNNYWYIGNYTDYNQNTSAIIKSKGTASIQLDETNTWRISTNRIHTSWAPETGTDAFKLHFPKFNDSSSTNKYWDYGLHLPTSYSDKFLYIRNASGSETLDNLLNDLDDSGYNYWDYKFYIDGEGNIHAGDIYSHDVLISGTSAPYLLKSGGTITGNLEVNGTLTKGGKTVTYLTTTPTSGQILVADGTSGSIKTSGYTIATSVPSGALFTDKNVQTSQANTTKIYLAGTPTTGTATGTLNFDSNVYLTTTAGTLHATTFDGTTFTGTAAKANQDGDGNVIKTTYLKLSGGQVTGPVSFGDSVSVDSLNVGDLIVSGAGRFANGLYGDLTGNADSATIAGGVADSGNGTETTFAYSKSGLTTASWIAAWNNYELRAISPANLKSTLAITKSDVGLGNVDNTADANKVVKGVFGIAGTANTNRHVWFSDTNPETSRNYDDNFMYNPSTNVLTVGSITGNAATSTTATKFNSVRTVALTGDVTGSASSDGASGWSIATTVQDNSHNHTPNNIIPGQMGLSGNLDPLTRTMIGSAASNKTFGLPSNAITIEYSTDGGSTWKDYEATDSHKKALFMELRTGCNTHLGKATTKEANSLNNQLRITIEPVDRYVGLDALYVWMSSQGNTVTVDLERSTIGAKDTYTTVFTGQALAGWSGNNIRYFTYGSFGGESGQTSNYYKYRLTFKQTAINSNYPSANIYDIRFLGMNVHSTANNIVTVNHLYTWDTDFNAIFPAGITATSFTGNASSASKLNSTRSFTIGNTAKNVDWSGAVSFSKAEISDDASSTANGWMSVADKKKLDSITVSDIGTIGANSIRGEKDIKVTISSGIATIGHENSAITAGTISGTATSTLSNGGSFKIPSITYDAYGHITGTAQTTITLPNITSVSSATTATKFNTSRSISLSGDVTGSASSNGESGWSIATTVADDSHYHTPATIKPLKSKTFTDVIGSENNWANAVFFYGSVKPNSWDNTWRIKYRIHVYVPNHPNYNQTADVMISGCQGNLKSYYSMNTIGQYYVCYYHELYRLKSAGFTNGYGHSIGVRFQSAYNPIDTDYKRTIEVEIYETDNCTFDFYDGCLKYAEIPGTGTTNYDSYSEMDFVNNGLRETGDDNTIDQNRVYYSSTTAVEAIYRYQMVLRTKTGQLVPVSSANNTWTIGKTYSSTPFDPFGEIYYFNSSGTVAANGNLSNAVLYRQVLVDMRYAFDITTDAAYKLVARQPVYLTATPQADGSAVLTKPTGARMPLTQTLPTSDDGLIYIYLGQAYEETNPYRIELTINHPVYWYKSGAVRPFTGVETGATFTGAVNFANNTLNLIGDDAYLGDQNVAGCIAIKGKNGATGIRFLPYSGSYSNTISNDGTGVLSMASSNTSNSTLKIINVGGGSSALVLERQGTNAADWRFINTSGTLKIQNNYTTTGVDYFDVLTLAYNTGNATFKGTVTGTKFIGSLQGNADSATIANRLAGFTSYSTSIGWGNQTGTPIMVMNDSTGGSVGFRRDNPANGQTSMVIDGTVYIKEGGVNISDAIKSITRSGTTFTYTTLWGNTGTFTQQDSDTKNTAGSTDTSSEIYLIGATSQAANPQTYSHDTARVRSNGNFVGSGYEMATSNAMGTTKAAMHYDSTLEAIVFSFS